MFLETLDERKIVEDYGLKNTLLRYLTLLHPDVLVQLRKQKALQRNRHMVARHCHRAVNVSLF